MSGARDGVRDWLQKGSGLEGVVHEIREMSYVFIIVVVIELYTFFKTQTVLLKKVNFTVCKFCLNKPF